MLEGLARMARSLGAALGLPAAGGRAPGGFAGLLFDSVPLALALRDEHGTFLFVNRTWEKYFDARREDVVGRSVRERMAPADAEQLLAGDRRALERGPGAVESSEFQYHGKALLQTRTVMADERGKVLGVLIASVDVSERRAMERELRDQMALTQAIVERTPSAIFLKDTQGRFTLVNRGWSEMSGQAPEQALGRTVHDIYPPELARRFAEEDARLLALGAAAAPIESLHQGPRPGQWRIVRKAVLTREDGTVQGLISTSSDVSEMKRIEAELRKSEEALRQSDTRYDLALRSTNEGVYDWNVAEGTIFYSDNVYRVLGAPASMKTPQDWRSRVHPEDLARYDAAVRAHFRGETERLECEYRYAAADGSWRWARQHGIAVRDGAGRAVRMIGATGDITALKVAEIERRDQLELTRTLIEENPNAMYLKDTQGRYVTVNDAWLKMVGVTREQAIGRTVLELFPERESQRYHDEDLRLVQEGGASEMESLRSGPAGPQWVIIRKAALRRADGSVAGLIGTNTDITRLKRYEAELGAEREALRNQVKFIHDLFDSVPASLVMRDPDGRFLFVNRTWETYTGRRREEVLGKPLHEAMPPEEAEEIRAHDRAALERGADAPLELLEYHFRGRRLSQTRTVMADESGKVLGVLVASMDVSERYEQEQRLLDQQRRLDLVVRGSRAGIVDWDGFTHATYYSPRLREILGHAPDADTAGWPDYFKVLLHPEDRERFTRRWQAFIKGRGPEGPRGEFLGPDEHRLRRKDGSYVWVEVNGIAVRDEKGFVTRWIAATTDITERRVQEEALRASVRLREEVERMSRHDLKTPMNSVIAMARLLREGGKLAREDEEVLASIERAGFRIVNMVNLSLDLFRMENGTYDFHPRAVDLADVARRVAEDLRSQAQSKGVEILVEELPDALPARAEELLCYSMLANLVKNAIEAAPDASRVSIVAEGRGEAALLHVHNAGAVPESVRARFFDKYASAGKSAGLGLGTYSARLMARVQGGDITLNTSQPEGTTISVRFRAAGEAVSRKASERDAGGKSEAFKLERKRVLVVDDDEFNRMVMRRLLPTPPLEVELAVNGRAALEAARASWPDTVFLDLEMPVMDGYEAARKLRELEQAEGRARCTIVAVSSNDEDAIVKRAHASGCDHYIVKPPSREALLRVLAGKAPMPSGAPPAGEPRPGDAVELDPDLEAGLPAFLDSRRKALEEFPRALAAGDRVAFRRLAHKLAGSFSLYGFRWAAAQCRALEQDAGGAPVAELEARARRVRAHLDDVKIRTAVKS